MCKRLFKALKIKMDKYKLRYELAGADEEIARLREHKEITDNLVEAYANKCKQLEKENILLKSEKRISNAQLKCLENAEKKIINLEDEIKTLEQDKISFAIAELEKVKNIIKNKVEIIDKRLDNLNIKIVCESTSMQLDTYEEISKEIDNQIASLKKGVE